ncbi:NUDIX domain-containing protein [Umezawaea sp. NPDC059074]|uniref:NUDIX domain-containing protein n=1 Tax=Umezawaea sp. NPDC059074 TaxID=3346716 RepID=UPI0036C9AC40
MTQGSCERSASSGFTADVVLFTRHDSVLSVLVVERAKEPYLAALALPGGFVEEGERTCEAAARELAEETGVVVDRRRLSRLGCYGRPGRDPRGRVVSVAFHGYVTGAPPPLGGSDARAAWWVPVGDMFAAGLEVAFDHREIIRDAVVRRFGWFPPDVEIEASPGAVRELAIGGGARPGVRRDVPSVCRSVPGSPRRR